MKAYRLVTLLLVLFISSAYRAAFGAGFIPSPNDESHISYIMYGEIRAGDVARVKQLIKRSEIKKLLLYVWSNGGDWEAAMAVGRELRASESVIIVLNKSVCLSACVLLLAGATNRIVYGGARIGIHRPFSASTAPITYKQAEARYRHLASETRAYLHEMNMPDTLWEAMASIPPEKIEFLSEPQLEAFRLVGEDPALREVEDANAARKLGITKETYYSRKAQVAPKCQALFPTQREINTASQLAVKRMAAYDKCKQAVLHGKR